jgi:hypothetical protein
MKIVSKFGPIGQSIKR